MSSSNIKTNDFPLLGVFSIFYKIKCLVYSLELPTTHFHDKNRKIPKISLNICFLELWEEFPRELKTFELATVNESSLFESLRFYCNEFEYSSIEWLLFAKPSFFFCYSSLID